MWTTVSSGNARICVSEPRTSRCHSADETRATQQSAFTSALNGGPIMYVLSDTARKDHDSWTLLVAEDSRGRYGDARTSVIRAAPADRRAKGACPDPDSRIEAGGCFAPA